MQRACSIHLASWSLALLCLLWTPAASAQPLDHIRNFHAVTPEIYRSAHLVRDDFVALAAFGIKHVVSLEDYLGDDQAAADEAQEAHDAALEFAWIPMDGLSRPHLAQLEQAVDYIAEPSHQPVLVHCLHGSDRTGMVIATYRIKYQHWPVNAARQEMYRYGHSILLSWWDHLLGRVNPAEVP